MAKEKTGKGKGARSTSKGYKVKEAFKQSLKTRGEVYSDQINTVRNIASDVGKFTTYAANGNVIGALSAGASAIATTTVGIAKSVVNFGKLGVANYELIKSIFNDPKWWTGRLGGQPKLNANEIRSFSPSELTAFSGTTVQGVGHMSSIGIEFNQLSKLRYWDTIVARMFEQIRATLKSNLMYDQSLVGEYFTAITSVLVEAILYARTMKFSNCVIPSVPEFKDVWERYPAYSKKNEQVAMFNRPDITDDFSQAVAHYNVLASNLGCLPVPKYLAEFVLWLVGSIFVDQSASNAQMYYVDPVALPLLTDKGEYVTYDPRVRSFNDILDDINIVQKKYAIVIADLAKTQTLADTFGSIDLVAYMSDVNGSIKYDYEFFQMLINAYTSADPSNKGFFRVDVMEKATKADFTIANAVAPMANALLSTQEQWFTIRNQVFYVDGRNTRVPLLSTKAAWNRTANNTVEASIVDSIVAYNTVSAVNGSTLYTEEPNNSVNAFLTKKFAAIPAGVGANMSITGRVDELNPFTGGTGVVTPDYVGEMRWLIASGQISTRGSSYADGPYYALYLRCTSVGPEGIRVESDNYLDFESDVGYSKSVSVNIDGNFQSMGGARFLTNVTFDSANELMPIEAFVDQLSSFSMRAVGEITAQYAVGTASTVTEVANVSTIAWLCQAYDYHIPYVVQGNHSFTDNTQKSLIIQNQPVLLKECYIPVMWNAADAKLCYEQMYLNLLT